MMYLRYFSKPRNTEESYGIRREAAAHFAHADPRNYSPPRPFVAGVPSAEGHYPGWTATSPFKSREACWNPTKYESIDYYHGADSFSRNWRNSFPLEKTESPVAPNSHPPYCPETEGLEREYRDGDTREWERPDGGGSRGLGCQLSSFESQIETMRYQEHKEELKEHSCSSDHPHHRYQREKTFRHRSCSPRTIFHSRSKHRQAYSHDPNYVPSTVAPKNWDDLDGGRRSGRTRKPIYEQIDNRSYIASPVKERRSERRKKDIPTYNKESEFEDSVLSEGFNRDRYKESVLTEGVNPNSDKEIVLSKESKQDFNKEIVLSKESKQDFGKEIGLSEESKQDFDKEIVLSKESKQDFDKEIVLSKESKQDFDKEIVLSKESKQDFDKEIVLSKESKQDFDKEIGLSKEFQQDFDKKIRLSEGVSLYSHEKDFIKLGCRNKLEQTIRESNLKKIVIKVERWRERCISPDQLTSPELSEAETVDLQYSNLNTLKRVNEDNSSSDDFRLFLEEDSEEEYNSSTSTVPYLQNREGELHSDSSTSGDVSVIAEFDYSRDITCVYIKSEPSYTRKEEQLSLVKTGTQFKRDQHWYGRFGFSISTELIKRIFLNIKDFHKLPPFNVYDFVCGDFSKLIWAERTFLTSVFEIVPHLVLPRTLNAVTYFLYVSPIVTLVNASTQRSFPKYSHILKKITRRRSFSQDQVTGENSARRTWIEAIDCRKRSRELAAQPYRNNQKPSLKTNYTWNRELKNTFISVKKNTGPKPGRLTTSTGVALTMDEETMRDSSFEAVRLPEPVVHDVINSSKQMNRRPPASSISRQFFQDEGELKIPRRSDTHLCATNLVINMNAGTSKTTSPTSPPSPSTNYEMLARSFNPTEILKPEQLALSRQLGAEERRKRRVDSFRSSNETTVVAVELSNMAAKRGRSDSFDAKDLKDKPKCKTTSLNDNMSMPSFEDLIDKNNRKASKRGNLEDNSERTSKRQKSQITAEHADTFDSSNIVTQQEYSCQIEKDLTSIDPRIIGLNPEHCLTNITWNTTSTRKVPSDNHVKEAIIIYSKMPETLPWTLIENYTVPKPWYKTLRIQIENLQRENFTQLPSNAGENLPTTKPNNDQENALACTPINAQEKALAYTAIKAQEKPLASTAINAQEKPLASTFINAQEKALARNAINSREKALACNAINAQEKALAYTAIKAQEKPLASTAINAQEKPLASTAINAQEKALARNAINSREKALACNAINAQEKALAYTAIKAQEKALAYTAIKAQEKALAYTAIKAQEKPLASTAINAQEKPLASTAINAQEKPLASTAINAQEKALARNAINSREKALACNAINVQENALACAAINSQESSLARNAINAREMALACNAINSQEKISDATTFKVLENVNATEILTIYNALDSDTQETLVSNQSLLNAEQKLSSSQTHGKQSSSANENRVPETSQENLPSTLEEIKPANVLPTINHLQPPIDQVHLSSSYDPAALSDYKAEMERVSLMATDMKSQIVNEEFIQIPQCMKSLHIILDMANDRIKHIESLLQKPKIVIKEKDPDDDVQFICSVNSEPERTSGRRSSCQELAEQAMPTNSDERVSELKKLGELFFNSLTDLVQPDESDGIDNGKIFNIKTKVIDMIEKVKFETLKDVNDLTVANPTIYQNTAILNQNIPSSNSTDGQLDIPQHVKENRPAPSYHVNQSVNDQNFQTAVAADLPPKTARNTIMETFHPTNSDQTGTGSNSLESFTTANTPQGFISNNSQTLVHTSPYHASIPINSNQTIIPSNFHNQSNAFVAAYQQDHSTSYQQRQIVSRDNEALRLISNNVSPSAKVVPSHVTVKNLTVNNAQYYGTQNLTAFRSNGQSQSVPPNQSQCLHPSSVTESRSNPHPISVTPTTFQSRNFEHTNAMPQSNPNHTQLKTILNNRQITPMYNYNENMACSEQTLIHPNCAPSVAMAPNIESEVSTHRQGTSSSVNYPYAFNTTQNRQNVQNNSLPALNRYVYSSQPAPQLSQTRAPSASLLTSQTSIRTQTPGTSNTYLRPMPSQTPGTSKTYPRPMPLQTPGTSKTYPRPMPLQTPGTSNTYPRTMPSQTPVTLNTYPRPMPSQTPGTSNTYPRPMPAQTPGTSNTYPRPMPSQTPGTSNTYPRPMPAQTPGTSNTYPRPMPSQTPGTSNTYPRPMPSQTPGTSNTYPRPMPAQTPGTSNTYLRPMPTRTCHYLPSPMPSNTVRPELSRSVQFAYPQATESRTPPPLYHPLYSHQRVYDQTVVQPAPGGSFHNEGFLTWHQPQPNP